MNSLTKAFSYLIAAQFQAIGLIFAAWWIGDWLNLHHPMQVSWYAVTFPIGVIGVAQTFYTIIRHVFKKNDQQKTEETKS
jgi:tellurite resistance protein TehA-like permease